MIQEPKVSQECVNTVTIRWSCSFRVLVDASRKKSKNIHIKQNILGKKKTSVISFLSLLRQNAEMSRSYKLEPPTDQVHKISSEQGAVQLFKNAFVSV